MNSGKKQIRIALIIFGISFLFMCAISAVRNAPGYMDEAYYFMGGQNLYHGMGFTENILWNYLDDPAGIPHPSHLYWMPSASIIAYWGMLLWGNDGYFAATFFFSILAAIVPAITYILAIRYIKDDFLSLLASGFSLFGGYYLVYYAAVETFTLYMLLGTMFVGCAAMWKPEKKRLWVLKAALLGAIAGLMHLTRADGILWLALSIFVLFAENIWQQKKLLLRTRFTQTVFLLAATVFAYVLVMFPWYSRNIQFFGTLNVPGAAQTMFLTKYDDLYLYPAADLTFGAMVEHGLANMVMERIQSFGMNMLSLLGVQHLVFLLPFTVIALWKRRKEELVIYLLIAWAMILGLMSFVFPFSGSRGGYFHSASALQIWLNILAAIGFGDFILWMVKKRGWNPTQSKRVLGIGFLAIFAVCSLAIGSIKMLPGDSKYSGWSADSHKFAEIDGVLTTLGIARSASILVNDPPSSYVFTQRPSLVIPNGGVEMVAAVMDRYGVEFLILQEDHPQKLHDLFTGAENPDQLVLIYTDQDFQIWQRN